MLSIPPNFKLQLRKVSGNKEIYETYFTLRRLSCKIWNAYYDQFKVFYEFLYIYILIHIYILLKTKLNV